MTMMVKIMIIMVMNDGVDGENDDDNCHESLLCDSNVNLWQLLHTKLGIYCKQQSSSIESSYFSL